MLFAPCEDKKTTITHGDNAVIPVGCQCTIELVMWGAAAAFSSTRSVFNLCCDGALHLPPLSPAVLKPDLRHGNIERDNNMDIRSESMLRQEVKTLL